MLQKLSTIQINLLSAPHRSDHPGVSGPEVCQGQSEADSEPALSPVPPPKWVLVCGFSPMHFSDVCAHVLELHIGQRLSAMRFRSSALGFKQSGKWAAHIGSGRR